MSDELGKAWQKYMDSMPPAPCDDCNYYSLCAAEELACSAFYIHVARQYKSSDHKHKQVVINKVPNKEWYIRVFETDTD